VKSHLNRTQVLFSKLALAHAKPVQTSALFSRLKGSSEANPLVVHRLWSKFCIIVRLIHYSDVSYTSPNAWCTACCCYISSNCYLSQCCCDFVSVARKGLVSLKVSHLQNSIARFYPPFIWFHSCSNGIQRGS